MVILRILFTAIVVIATLSLQAGSDYPQKFENLSIKDGLSHNNVYCAIQDDQGILWFGTSNGLNRYDGYTFQTFKYNPNNSNSLSSNYVRCLLQDSNGNIWAGTDKGLTRYDTENGIFTIFLNESSDSSSISNNNIRALLEDHNGNIWIGTAGGGVNFLANSDKLNDKIEFKRFEFGTSKKNYVYTIFEDKKDNIWFGTESNIILFRKNSVGNEYDSYQFPLFDSDSNSIRHITEGINNSLIISTYAKGVYEFTFIEEKLDFFAPENCYFIKSIANSGSKFTNSCFIDSKGNLWIGTRGSGITYIDGYLDNKKDVINLSHDTSIKNSISGNFINDFFEDKSGIIWILMAGEGICNYIPNRKPFHILGDIVSNVEQLRNITSVVEDEKNNLLISTRNNGLLIYEMDGISDNGKKQCKLIDLGWSSDKEIITKILKVGEHYWMATSGNGIKVFNQKGQLINHFLNKEDQNSLSHDYVHELFQDSRGLIWIGTWGGTYGGGLDMYNPVTKKFTHYFNKKGDTNTLSQNIVLSIEEDVYGQIWVGTKSAGLNLLKIKNGSHYFQRFKSIAGDSTSLDDDHVTDIYKAKNNTLWITTESGLSKFNYNKLNFERINLINELDNQKLGSILEDKNKNIWLTTSAGLIRYNPSTHEAMAFNNVDGLHTGYGDGIVLRDSKENVFFGQKGLMIFNPDEIKINPVAPPVVLTDIEIFNLDKKSDNASLHLTIHSRNKITLPFRENNFALQFAALNYVKPEKNKYAYRLDGYDEKGQWHYRSSGNRIVNYSNLREGEYIFRVKASNNDGIWNEDGKTLAIKILPPYYRSVLAYVFYLVFISVLVYSFIRLIVKREEEKNRLELERLEHKKMEEINQSKLRFFTNISHEFRTPLTLILAPVERLLKSSGLLHEERKNELYLGIHKNASRLLRLINELMDFRKLEAGSLKIKQQNADIVGFINNIYSCFEEMAEEREIQFNLIVPDKEIIVSFDPDKLEKVIFNLLSNAFNFVPNRGIISLSLSEKDDEKVTIQVTDNGKGIQPNEIDKVFQRFYQTEKVDNGSMNKQGTGIGLTLAKSLVEMHGGEIAVTSVPNEKTCFTVTIPHKSKIADQEKTLHNPEIYLPGMKHTEFLKTNNNGLKKAETDEENDIRYKLLIVDDNQEIRSFLKSEFQQEYAVIEADNGKTGLDEVLDKKPDIVISDIMMPEMNGFEFCRKLKSKLNTSHIPVILLTSKSTEESLIEGLETGADAYVAKPFNISVLEVRVRKLIETRQHLRNLYSTTLEPEPKSLVTNTLDENFLGSAISVVEENLDDSTLNVEMFCQKMGMGKTSLHDKIKALTGKSTGEFIRSIRLKHAARMLAEGRLNVSEVSYSVGFNTVWYFSKCFKKEFNIAPSDYAKGDVQRLRH